MNRLALRAGINERGKQRNWNIVLTEPISGDRLDE
jgi:hypothetical protein